MARKNLNNPANIQSGDTVRLKVEWDNGIKRVFPVASVTGELDNIVYCLPLGRNHYASEFSKVRTTKKS